MVISKPSKYTILCYLQIHIPVSIEEFTLLAEIECILFFDGVIMSMGCMNEVCITCEQQATSASEVAPMREVVGWALFKVLQ